MRRFQSMVAGLFLLGCLPRDLDVPEVSIDPASPTPDDELVVTASCESCSYRWFMDDALQSGLTGNTISAGLTETEQTWRVLVNETDGDREGPPGEASVLITEAAPTLQISLSSDEVYTDDILEASVSVDGEEADTGSYSYAWMVDGEVALEGAGENSLDGSIYFDKDQEVYVDVTPVDGSEAVSSDSVIVLNTAPGSPELSITQPNLEAQIISSGNHHICLLDANGSIECWGKDHVLQVTDTPSGDGYIDLDAGHLHSCALDSVGQIECWGDDTSSQSSSAPDGSGYTWIGAGGYQSCSLDSDGAIDCWGDDTYGQTSDVPTDSGYTEIEVGRQWACAINSAAEIHCWGDDTYGQTSDAPIGSGYSGLSAMAYHACALDSTGAIECWGLDDRDQVSNGPSGSDYQLVETGYYYTCALDSDGYTSCWGNESSTKISGAPTTSGFSLLALGELHGCAIGEAGAPECWGDDAHGQSSDVPEMSNSSLLLCSIETESTDADGDDVSYTFEWDVDGEAFTEAETTNYEGDTVPESALSLGTEWTCTVTPNDGDEDGDSASAWWSTVCFEGWEDPALSAGDADYVFLGESSADYAGRSVAWAGDVDGDGLDDLLVGAAGSDDGGTDSGKAYLFLATSLGSTSSLDLSSADYTFIGEEGGDGAGNSVSSAGDVDGDGLADLLIGAPANNGAGTHAGRSYLILGVSLGDEAEVDLSEADCIISGVANDYAGEKVASAGDVDGDGLGDLLMMSQYNSEGGVSAGKIYLVLGASLAGASEISLADADYSFIGEQERDNLSVMAGAGDIDGDGLDDILLGTLQNSEGGSNAGKVYVFLGASLDDSREVELTTADYSFRGDSEENLGLVAGGGDLDGDGLDDILLGAVGDDDAGSDAGRAYVFLGSSLGESESSAVELSTADYSFTGEASGDNAGLVSPAGDVDGDGLADLWVGAYLSDEGGTDSGKAYLFLGSSLSSISDLSLSEADYSIVGESGGDVLGVTFGGVGDVNGDGLADLFVGASQNDENGTDAGKAYVFVTPNECDSSETDACADGTTEGGSDWWGRSDIAYCDFDGPNTMTPDEALDYCGDDWWVCTADEFMERNDLLPDDTTDFQAVIDDGDDCQAVQVGEDGSGHKARLDGVRAVEPGTCTGELVTSGGQWGRTFRTESWATLSGVLCCLPEEDSSGCADGSTEGGSDWWDREDIVYCEYDTDTNDVSLEVAADSCASGWSVCTAEQYVQRNDDFINIPGTAITGRIDDGESCFVADDAFESGDHDMYADGVYSTRPGTCSGAQESPWTMQDQPGDENCEDPRHCGVICCPDE